MQARCEPEVVQVMLLSLVSLFVIAGLVGSSWRVILGWISVNTFPVQLVTADQASHSGVCTWSIRK